MGQSGRKSPRYMETNYEQLWQRIKPQVMSRLPNKSLQIFFNSTQLRQVDQQGAQACFEFGVPSKLHEEKISDASVQEALKNELAPFVNQSFSLRFVVDKALFEKNQPPAPPSPHEAAAQAAPRRIVSPRKTLNETLTLDSFVVGRSNEFAHAACCHIAQDPGAKGHNPLYIYGPSGLGKTHLLHAVGNYISQYRPHLRVKYCLAENFVNEFVSSLQRKTMPIFRKRYRDDADVLLIDDIQFFSSRSGSREEFFHTIEKYLTRGQQVAFVSDSTPAEVPDLEDRVRSRLEWGVIIDIQRPDLEHRMAIVKEKLAAMNIVMKTHIIEYIANVSKHSIRQLEGNLNTVTMLADFQGNSYNDLEFVQKTIAKQSKRAEVTTEDIQKIVAHQYGIKSTDLKSRSRLKDIVAARQLAMFYIRNTLNHPLAEIGKLFGGKDHSTVLNALRKVDQLQHTDSELRQKMMRVKRHIESITGV